MQDRVQRCGRKEKMKINQFLKEKKWSILSGVAFLTIFAVIAGAFAFNIISKYNRLAEQVDHLASAISSLETSPSKNIIDEMLQKIDGISRKPELDTTASSLEPELQPKLEALLKYISDLDQKMDAIKAAIEAGDQPTESAEDTMAASTAEIMVETAAEATPETATESVTETAAEVLTDIAAEIEPDMMEPQMADNKPEKTGYADSIKAGHDFTVTVKANEVVNLYGYQFNLNYDNKKAAYKDSLKSSVSEISTIFKKDMSDHLLVGATMIGNAPGYSGQNVTMCTMVFTATEDLDPSAFAINGVSIVDAEQNYVENISGWSIEVKNAS
jgi:prefoldin subunit 5